MRIRCMRVGGGRTADPSRCDARAAFEGFALAVPRDQAVLAASGGGATGCEGRAMRGKRAVGVGFGSRTQPCERNGQSMTFNPRKGGLEAHPVPFDVLGRNKLELRRQFANIRVLGSLLPLLWPACRVLASFLRLLALAREPAKSSGSAQSYLAERKHPHRVRQSGFAGPIRSL